jgi:TM2 domain-containing membrane protein YozV
MMIMLFTYYCIYMTMKYCKTRADYIIETVYAFSFFYHE